VTPFVRELTQDALPENWQQEKFVEKRAKREQEKRKELDLGASEHLTQQAERDRNQKRKETEKTHRKVVKKLHAKTREPADTTTKKQMKPSQTKQGKNKTKNNNIEKEATKVQTTRRVTKAPQGERKVPVASDKHGCEHSGLLELLAIDRGYLRAYVKEGGWLHRTPCKDCAMAEDNMDDRVLDVATLLTSKGKKEIGYYCNCGATGHKMDIEAEPEWKRKWTCDMVLCMPCYDKRKQTMGDGGGKRTRKRKGMD
jgi:hypothetical protein